MHEYKDKDILYMRMIHISMLPCIFFFCVRRYCYYVYNNFFVLFLLTIYKINLIF